MATQVYTITKLGPKRSLTPEGFLLCEAVPIARTGMMLYGPNETPIKAGRDGMVKIHREADTVFAPETIASFNGKPVTIQHPDADVVPDTWKDLAHGVAMNVRRGEGHQDDLLLADFLVTTPEGIEAIQQLGIEEVSCGYTADYEEIAEGVGRQLNIIGNHIALVESGRCGPRCAIGDQKSKETNMGIKALDKLYAKLKKAIRNKDEEAVKEIAEQMANHDEEEEKAHDEDREDEVHVHVHGNEDDEMGEGRTRFTDDDIQEHMDQNEAEHAEMRSRIETLEQLVSQLMGEEGETEDEIPEEELKEEVPEAARDSIRKARDSAHMKDSFKETVAYAEILVPGIRIPTFDRAAKQTDTFKTICGLRRQALDLAYAQPATRAIIDDLNMGKTLSVKDMSCGAVRQLFKSAALVRKSQNNDTRSPRGVQVSTKKTGVASLAELNARNNEYYTK